MEIKPGYYKTREGLKARVLHIEEGGRLTNRCIGFYFWGIDCVPCAWGTDGKAFFLGSERKQDLIEPWVDPPVLVPHWPALLCSSKIFCVTGRLYTSETEGKESHGNDFVRLAKEYPPVMLEVKD